ncbi:hypothetical protein D3C75_1144150 [compost metagenome]
MERLSTQRFIPIGLQAPAQHGGHPALVHGIGVQGHVTVFIRFTADEATVLHIEEVMAHPVTDGEQVGQLRILRQIGKAFCLLVAVDHCAQGAARTQA